MTLIKCFICGLDIAKYEVYNQSIFMCAKCFDKLKPSGRILSNLTAIKIESGYLSIRDGIVNNAYSDGCYYAWVHRQIGV